MYLSNLKIVHLEGGMGNQLFQYAFARALELRTGCTVKFDGSFFRAQSERVLCLDKFNTKLLFANKCEIENSLEIKKNFFEKLLGLKNSQCLEKSVLFDGSCFSKKHKQYFKGFWQSEKYFKDIEEVIRKELTITNTAIGQNAVTIKAIKLDPNSVSLHVRRGDYLSKQNYKIHGVCGLDYYNEALIFLKSNIGKFNLYIFSDDIDWAKNNINYSGRKIFIDWNDDQSNYEDLRLMSLCKHNIIANSSFSWWGAWLNENPDKIVLAPKQWFANPIMDRAARTIVPDSWIKI